MRRLLLAITLGVALVVALRPDAAGAHPLGNVSINTALEAVVRADVIEVRYLIDQAEIPTVRDASELDASGSAVWSARRCADVAALANVRVDGIGIPLRFVAGAARRAPGTAGLDTLRVDCRFTAATGSAAAVAIDIQDGWAGGKPGWHEVVVRGEGVEVASDAPSVSPSALLTEYPTSTPLAVTSAAATATPTEDSTADALAARLRAGGLVFVGALAIAVGLGMVHSLGPGHGKTVMAAFLVHGRGGLRDALKLAATVAASHTVGVVALGALLASTSAADDTRLYPLLGGLSGVFVALVGVSLLRSTRRRAVHDHAHAHGHPRDHHSHHHRDDAHNGRRIAILGVAGGLVPSPSAVLVLLAGTSTGRIEQAVALVVAYGLGLGIALVAIGGVLNRLRPAVESLLASPRVHRLSDALPLWSAVAVFGGGVVLSLRSVAPLF